jgi:hypothetical protein
MNVEIGAEAALFPEKEYIYGIFVAVHANKSSLDKATSVDSIKSSRGKLWCMLQPRGQIHSTYFFSTLSSSVV